MQKISISNMIIEDLKEQILAGKYKSGDKIPDERSLADGYRVSRVSVRKALEYLRQEGILVTKRGAGTYVTGINSKILEKKDINHLLVNQNIVLETIRLRELIESQAARFAAQNATEEDIKIIQKNLIEGIDEIRKLKSGSNNVFFESDIDFHRSIAIASKNELFIDFIDTMHETISAHQFLSLQETEPTDEVVSYHTSIFEAIISHNPEGAKEMMNKHLSRVEELIKKGFNNVKKENNKD